MNRLLRIVRRQLSKFVAWLKRPFSRSYRSCVVEGELPARLRSKLVYIVEEDGFKEHVSMICPCGCQQVLHMNLLPDERPCWQVTEHRDGAVTLHPSVWRQKGCCSHFWLRKGEIHWC